MTRQIIDTTTNNGSYIGDPAKIAFEKTNSNFEELYDEKLDSSSSTGIEVETPNFSVNGPQVGSGQFAGNTLLNLNGNPGSNADSLFTRYYRADTTGSTSWSDFNFRLGRIVDGTYISYIQFLGNRDIEFTAGASMFTMQSGGNAVAQGSWVNGGSDPAIKQKDSLRPIDDATSAVCGLNVRFGKYLPEFNADGKERAFVMADDAMREHTPQAIIEEVIQGKYAGWATDQLIAYLVAACQEARIRESELLARMTALEVAIEKINVND